jgi:TRAP-type C4-dicarboxylate transport system substrate-binding protein
MKRLCILAVIATVALVAPLASTHAANLKLLTSWNRDNWPTYAVLEQYVKNVDAIGAGSVKISLTGKEVVPPFEQLQPVSAGVFDMLFSHGVYHAGSKGIALVADAIDADIDKRRSSGVWGFIDSYYQKNNNLKLVALIASSSQGYHIFLKKPLSANNDLEGRKIRGTQSYHGVIRLLGASPVVLPGGQIYSALEKGVVDGAAWPAAGMLSMKHFEVAKYRIRPTFGTSNQGVWVNLAKWNGLSKVDQKVLLDAGLKTEREMQAIGDDILAKEDATLDKMGLKYTRLTPENYKRVMATWNSSLWDVAAKCCGDGADKLRELAKKAGLTN